MTTIFNEMQEYKTLDMMIEIEFPREKPQLRLKLPRMSNTEEAQAEFKAEGQLRERKIFKEEVTEIKWREEFNFAFFYELGKHVLQNIEGWDVLLDGVDMPFNKINFDCFKKSRSTLDTAMLGFSYFNKTREAKESKKKPTAKVSLKQSKEE